MLILDVAGDETGFAAVDSSFSVLCVAFKTMCDLADNLYQTHLLDWFLA